MSRRFNRFLPGTKPLPPGYLSQWRETSMNRSLANHLRRFGVLPEPGDGGITEHDIFVFKGGREAVQDATPYPGVSDVILFGLPDLPGIEEFLEYSPASAYAFAMRYAAAKEAKVNIDGCFGGVR